MPKLLTETFKNNKTYWGDTDFVDSVIEQVNIDNKIAEGGFGETYKVLHERTLFLVKKMGKVSIEDFNSEVDASNELQAAIPDFVAQLKGARFDTLTDNQYIIYDFLEGNTLTKVLKDAEDMKHDVKTMHKMLSYLYAALIKAQNALKDTEFVHSDIKPDNLFFKFSKSDWSDATCKFIDFGGTRKVGSNIHTISDLYSASVVNYEDWPPPFRSGGRAQNINFIIENKLNPEYNLFSINRIWQINMIPLLQKICVREFNLDKPMNVQAAGYRRRTRKGKKVRLRYTDARY